MSKSKGYEGYQELMGFGPSEEQKKARQAAGITSKHFNFKGKGNEWNCTIYFDRDGEPLRMNYYIWSATNEQMMASLEAELGYPVEMVKSWGGNGHYTADMRRAKND